MALKHKITKAEYDVLDPIIQAEYKGDGAGYVLDTDATSDDTTALRSALERNKTELRELRAQQESERERIARETEERIRDELRASGNTEELENRYRQERETLRTEMTGSIEKRNQQLTRVLVADRAQSLARELCGDAWAVMLPHIQCRLTADLDADVPACKVLTADGQSSTLSIEDLKKEFLNNPAFASIIVGVDSSGGGATRKKPGAAGKKPEEYTQQERIDLFNTNRAEYDRLFPVKN